MAEFNTQGRSMMLDVIMGFLYDPVIKKQDKAIVAIANQHGKSSPEGNTNFKFRGKQYAYGNRVFGYPRNLNKALVPEMAEIVERQDTLLWYEKPLVASYLTNMLNLAKSPPEVVGLLPDKIANTLTRKFGEEATKWEGAVPQRLLEFHNNNSEASDLIKQRLLINMLIQ